MPTITRLAAMVFFGLAAYFLTELYYAEHALERRSLSGGYIMTVFASLVGWRLVGPKIDRSVLRAFGLVFQGMGSTLFFALSFSGLVAIFTNPAHRRFTSLEQAAKLLSQEMWEHFERLFATAFALRLLETGTLVALLLVMVFRLAEARRLAR